MPVKRRRAKGRAQLSAGQRAFLDSLPFPQPDEFYGDKNAPGWYRETLVHSHLTSPWRADAPPYGVGVSGPTAAELWAAYGAEVTAEWIERNPGTRPPAWWRFDAPVCPVDGDEGVDYLRRHRLLTPEELRRLR
jgi:hypothetical protein